MTAIGLPLVIAFPISCIFAAPIIRAAGLKDGGGAACVCVRRREMIN